MLTNQFQEQNKTTHLTTNIPKRDRVVVARISTGSFGINADHLPVGQLDHIPRIGDQLARFCFGQWRRVKTSPCKTNPSIEALDQSKHLIHRVVIDNWASQVKLPFSAECWNPRKLTAWQRFTKFDNFWNSNFTCLDNYFIHNFIRVTFHLNVWSYHITGIVIAANKTRFYNVSVRCGIGIRFGRVSAILQHRSSTFFSTFSIGWLKRGSRSDFWLGGVLTNCNRFYFGFLRFIGFSGFLGFFNRFIIELCNKPHFDWVTSPLK